MNRKLFVHYFNAFKLTDAKKGVIENIEDSYEKNPYDLSKILKNDFFNASLKEKRYLLFTLKRNSAIDTISILEELKAELLPSDEIYDDFMKVFDILIKTEKEVNNISNPYEFVEQSNDLTIIKGLIRKQILEPDKNLIIKLLNDNRLSVKKPSCVVAGYLDDINVISTLINHLEKPDLSLWAQLALKKIGSKTIKYLEIEYSKRKENLLFVESCFTLLCKIESEDGYRLLFKSLNEADSNIRKIAAKKIIIFGIKATEEHRKYFKKLFDDLVLTLLSNGYLIEQIQSKNESFKSLKSALINENKEAIYLIINILKLYYNPTAVEEIFKNYTNNSPEAHAASNLLIDTILSSNLAVKNKIKILFSPNERILLEGLQEEFPSINLQPKFETEEDLIWVILKKEYDQINSWTRTCALNILQYEFKEDIPFELAAEFLNENTLLQECAAANIYKNLPEFYTIFLDRLSEIEATNLDYSIRSNLDVANPKQINHDNLLLFDKINFLISIPYLNQLSISEILTCHSYFRTKVLKAGEHQISLKDDFNLGFWLIENGQVSCSKNGIDFYKYHKRDIIKVTEYDSSSENIYFYTEEDVRFLIIDEIILSNIINNYDEIIQKYIDILPDKKVYKPTKKLNQEAA
ncbi:hypothetical protein [Marivirga sp.]|uniref:hypothetical protein n=1 Tax=Marivirga sp. TaxID=2018662 RepID=UPI002D801DFE|nr:hypothetical protein [Marivirga sp.]HET8859755.1 hypothetical protein [Marivirga sp.]